MSDFIRDWIEIIGITEGSNLHRERLVKKVQKFERTCKKVGTNVNDFPQWKFVETLTANRPEEFREMMKKFCMIRLKRGDFSDWTGWEYRNDWATASYHPSVANKRWRLEPVESLAVLGEQGIGDEIMFASCLPDLKKRVSDITIECDPRLVEVFRRSFDVKTLPRDDIVKRGESVQYLTKQRPQEKFIPIGDLPRFFRKSRADFPRVPFLKPLPEYVEKWGHLRGRTGIAWRGRTGQFDPKVFGIKDPVCLQYDAWDYETQGMEVPRCDLRNDVEDLLGISANLERIVSVSQTIVHIAGSIGAKVDVVLAPVGSARVVNQIAYRYVPGWMPWYKSTFVYRSLKEWQSRQ